MKYKTAVVCFAHTEIFRAAQKPQILSIANPQRLRNADQTKFDLKEKLPAKKVRATRRGKQKSLRKAFPEFDFKQKQFCKRKYK